MLICILVERERKGSEEVYVLYTHLNVDNYGWPLIDDQMFAFISGFLLSCY